VNLSHASQLTRRGGLPLWVVHSHPFSEAVPSDLDLRWAQSHDWDSLAIFSLPDDELRLWRRDGEAFVEVEFESS
jgi:proteasome lid subunit RPN8/RPN11